MKLHSALAITVLTICTSIGIAGTPLVINVPAALKETKANYAAEAEEVTQNVQTDFYLAPKGLYAKSLTKRDTDFMWANGVTFSALVGAARHDPEKYVPLMKTFFKSMDHYWDTKAPVPGYEPAPTSGNGHDKYYDDNAWMVLTFLEAYELTHDAAYLQRADESLKFVLSGWDDQLGGGIWWHEGHKGGGKNTCANAPAAVGCLNLANCIPPDAAAKSVDMAKKIVEWTTKNLQADDGLFFDNINVTSRKIGRAKFTYNTALMIRANVGLYRQTGKIEYLQEAQREAKAADALLDKQTHVYHDSFKFTHLLVEADLELYRATGEDYLLRRSMDNADFAYATWRTKRPNGLIENAGIARMLWLMADMQTDVGLKFWQRAEQTKAAAH